jgi:hypothetical protein
MEAKPHNKSKENKRKQMTVIRGLKKIQERDEARDAEIARRKEAKDKPKNTWFKLEDGDSVKIAFLQELDEDSPNFSSKNDLGVQAVEHNNPDKYWRKAECTEEEDGGCWACEKHREDYKAGWGQKNRLYINVLVNDGTNEPYTAILSQSTGPRSITPILKEEAVDEGTITTKWFSVKRTGSEVGDTAYSIRAKEEHGLNVEDYDVVDLSTVLKKVPYEQQEAFYLGTAKDNAEKSEAKVPVSAASVDADW